jgi:hypothetical protein
MMKAGYLFELGRKSGMKTYIIMMFLILKDDILRKSLFGSGLSPAKRGDSIHWKRMRKDIR